MDAEKYHFLLWQMIAAEDSGLYDGISPDEVSRRATDGSLAQFLRATFTTCDFSIYEPRDWNVMTETFAGFANAIDARRKFLVNRKGVCLLMAYALEGLQILTRKTAP